MTDAWLGWKNYISNGKLAALLLAALVFLWYHRKQVQQQLVLYTSVITVCCIVPVTAVLLMKYQTRFYDYEWIWSLVPLTAVTAYGITLFLTEYWKDLKAAEWYRGLPVTALLLAVILFCGGMGRQVWDKEGQEAEKQQAYGVLKQLLEMCPDEALCLWAPREIMEYAREMDGSIRLLYGRNMWDLSLNGYSYDTYDEVTVKLYQWMEQEWETDMPGDGKEENVPGDISLEEYVKYAIEAGVDCILLPPDTEPETVRRMEEILGMKAVSLEGYWVYHG